jgi:DNA-binding LytR/AlgR family response regulator
MEVLRALLVDDEPLANRRLARALEGVGGIEVVGSTTSARRAVEMIGSDKPDIVFLDIAMPGLTGFQVIEKLAPFAQPAIVFVTAYDAHAVQAFDVAAVDYLLKPVAPERLEEAVSRGRMWIEARSARGPEAPAPARLDAFWVHRHRELLRVGADEVDWIEAEGDYARIHAPHFSGLVRTTLTSLEARLVPAGFVRVHRSALCRRDAIVSVRRKATGAMVAQLANGDEVPVGRSYAASLKGLTRRLEAARP